MKSDKGVKGKSSKPPGTKKVKENIAGRKRTEMLLRQSLEQIDLLNVSSYILYRCEAFGDFNATYIGGNIESMLGYKPDDFLKKGFWASKIHPEDGPRIFTELNQLLEHSFHKHEYRFQHKNGSWRWMYEELRLNRDEQGNPKEILGSMADITERKRIEEELFVKNKIANIFLTSTTDEEMYNEVLKVVLEVMESKYGVVGYIDADGALVVPSMSRHIWDKCQVPEKTFIFPRDKWGHSSWSRAIREKKSNYTNEPSDLIPEGHIPVLRHISMPIIFQGEVIGLIQVANKETDYGEKDVQLLELIGNSIVTPILNARLQRDRQKNARNLAEEALRESEDRYRDLVEHSDDLLCTHDLEGKLLSVNPAVLRIGGYSKDELLGMNFGDFLAPEVRGQFGNYLTEIQAKGAASGVMLVQTKGGEKRLWEYHNTLRTEDIAAPIVRGMARDITERKQAEEALRRSEERFRQLYDNAPVGYFEYDTQGRITSVNRTEWEMLGYTFDEMIGQPVWKFIVEEEETRQQILAKLAGTMPPARGFERIYKKKDGTVLPVSIEDRILQDPQGRITGIRCTIQDITDRKKADEALRSSEEKYRTILENIEDGYFEVDIAGNFTFYNDSLCRLLGYSRDEMMGMNNRQYTDNENAKKMYQTFNRVYRTGKPTKESDWEIIRKDGTKRSNEASVSLIKDSSGNLIGFRGIVRDITERKRAEEEKATLQEQLRQSQKIEAIGRLSGGIAHDFNNILTIISGNAQLSLLDLKQGDPLRENIEEIRRASERAADLTRQLLAFSRKQVMEMKVLDLNHVVQGLDKMLHRLLGEDIDLVTVLPEGIRKVKADPGQIEQVIVNLAVNARDAMIEGGKLTIETADVELDEEYARKHIAVIPGRYVMLSVSDTGVGMSSEVKDRIFEPFFTTKEQGKGTGLGLSTVYGIVKQSGGNVWVYSEPGQGTTFKIYLPQVDEPLTEQKQEVVKEIPRGNETILVVEDEETVRKLAIRLLEGQGYKVLEAPDGGKALLLCEKFKERIHLLLTDVVMPGMSGRKLAERLKEIQPEMKVLYMSGYTDNAIAHHGILEPGINFMQKPFTLEKLARKVREALDK